MKIKYLIIVFMAATFSLRVSQAQITVNIIDTKVADNIVDASFGGLLTDLTIELVEQKYKGFRAVRSTDEQLSEKMVQRSQLGITGNQKETGRERVEELVLTSKIAKLGSTMIRFNGEIINMETHDVFTTANEVIKLNDPDNLDEEILNGSMRILDKMFANLQNSIANQRDMKGYVEFPDLNLMVQVNDAGKGNWEQARRLCSESRVGGFNDWQLPTDVQLQSILSHRRSGELNFTKDGVDYYWTVESGVFVRVSTKSVGNGNVNATYNVRAVRKIN